MNTRTYFCIFIISLGFYGPLQAEYRIKLLSGGGGISHIVPAETNESHESIQAGRPERFAALYAGVYLETRNEPLFAEPDTPETGPGGLFAFSGLFLYAPATNRETKDTLIFLPGKELYLGYEFCPRGNCYLFLGGYTPPYPEDLLTGERSRQTGALLRYETIRSGSFTVAPLLLSSPHQRPRIPGSDTEISPSRAAMGRGFSSEQYDFDDYGFRFSWAGNDGISRGPLRFGLFHEIRRRRGRPNPESEFLEQLVYTGGAVSLKLETKRSFLNLVFALEEVQGRLQGHPLRKRDQPYQDIRGFALRASLFYSRGPLHIALRLFLPEPAHAEKGSAPTGREKSGYTGPAGDSLSYLNHRRRLTAAPGLCRNELNCRGLEEPGLFPDFFGHAARTQFSLEWRGKKYRTGLNLEVHAPLRADLKTHSFPSNIKPEARRYFYELNLRLIHKAGLRLEYARLEHYAPRNGRRLLAEAIFIGLEIPLNNKSQKRCKP